MSYIVNKDDKSTIMILSFRTDRQVWANSADPDQTAPRGAVLSGSSLTNSADTDQTAPRGTV